MELIASGASISKYTIVDKKNTFFFSNRLHVTTESNSAKDVSVSGPWITWTNLANYVLTNLFCYGTFDVSMLIKFPFSITRQDIVKCVSYESKLILKVDIAYRPFCENNIVTIGMIPRY